MPRKYEKVQELLPTVKALVKEGYTQQQIAEQLGLGGKGDVKELLSLYVNSASASLFSIVSPPQ